MKHRGIKIVPVKVTRYEVRTVDGRRKRSFATLAAAKAWADGYLKAFDELAPKEAQPAESPEATAARSRAHPLHPDRKPSKQ